MIRLAISLSLALAVCFLACTDRPSLEAKPEAKLIGKWEEVAAPQKRIPLQFEFFTDGTVIENDKILGKWQQLGTGSFKFMFESLLPDVMSLKAELRS